MRSVLLAVLSFVVFAFVPLVSWAQEEGQPYDIEDEFSFDVTEFEKSPVELGGYFQTDLGYLRFNRESAFYRLNFTGKEQENGRWLGGVELQPDLTWQEGAFKAFFLANLKLVYTGEEWLDDLDLYEGYLSWQINPNAYASAGKTLVRWGKGYAWNPVNFVGRPKVPDDPALAQEGYWMALGDVIRSYSGALKGLAVTGVALPVYSDINSEFGKDGYINWSGKLYFLLYDTDIDLMFLSEGSKSARYGIDFSRNIASNWEIHGEWALFSDFTKPAIESDGTRSTQTYDAQSYLMGTRYLAPTETTFILEYYHNGRGYTQDEVKDFFNLLDQADDSQLPTLKETARPFQNPNYMRDYFYLKASQKEPFGLLYLTPSLISIINLDDGSYNVIPEVFYTAITNLELRFRLNLLSGDEGTEYGEKLSDWRAELRARLFF